MAPQAAVLPLLRGNTTFQSAVEQEEDMLIELDYPEQRIDFFLSLYSNREDIANVAAYHLGLSSLDTCQVGGVKEWIHGSFNVCIPLYVTKGGRAAERQAVIRFPLPYKVGESKHPGNVDEKTRCEAATFIWIQENCPEVPIPKLWGFGVVGGHSFTKPQNVPFMDKAFWWLRRSLSWLLGYTLPCNYVPHHRPALLEHGYLVMDFIGDSEVQMLSETWDRDRHHHDKRHNLFRGLSRIILSLSQIELPSLGAWTLDLDGYLRLSNRPLTLRLHQFENAGIPTGIRRDMTYPTTESYYLDLLSLHDNRMFYQPNSMDDADDGRAQMARLTIMRALLPHFTNRELRQGPFLYRLTDLHPSNIFVDSNWNIKSLVDLEWSCSLPAETLRAPYWLTGRSIDELSEDHLEPFERAYKELLEVFEEEEKKLLHLRGMPCYRTQLMRQGWRTGSFWYFHALESPKGLFNLFRQHIQPIFTATHQVSDEFSRIVSDYWTADVESVINSKLRDREEYQRTLSRRFEQSIDRA